jgi:tetratricopeptide (TPR) repeat protein
MTATEAEQEFAKGMAAFRKGNSPAALAHFEKAAQLGAAPLHLSYLGYCIARERGQMKKGIALCQDALAQEPDHAEHFLNLGRIHLMAGNKLEAIRIFREGLANGSNREIIAELDALGARKPPVIRMLRRDNPINKYLGIILHRLGLR